MSAQVFCGRCGYPLDGPHAICRVCGTQAGGLGAGFAARRGKNPWVAAGLSVVPGLGHLYAGDYRKGFALLGLVGVLQFVGLDLDLTVVGAALGIPMELGGFGLWAYGIMDAYRVARAADPSYSYR